ncbi:MAG TPA: OmpA family protein [Gemmatimonadaceae bacterium]|nr:OmpA family protein [Gemmatimonadaceae bacterium]
MIRPTSLTHRAARTRAAVGAAVVVALGACASAQKPATLQQAESIYQRLASSGAEQRAEADMIRSREAIAQAQNAASSRQNRDYVAGLANIALRTAQTAEAHDAQVLAQSATDSLTKTRLARLLSLSETQRANLAAQQQLSQAEISALRERNMLVTQQADSLRQANEAANARLDSALTKLRGLVVEITNLQETSRGLVISLSDILFDVNKATLKPGSEANVRRIATILQEYPDKQISVEGHTDATGSDAYNQKLSEDRAASVRAALVAGGVNPAQITSRGFGKTQPVASNDTPTGRQQNRRVEIVVLGAGKVADAAAAAARRDSTAATDTTRKPPQR